MARKTYGEVIVEEKNKMKMVDGVFIIVCKSECYLQGD